MNIRFGIVGLGGISRRFAKALNSVDGVELTAVAASDPAKAKAFASEFGAKKVCQSYADLINDKEVDAIYIGLTTNFHYEITRQCLEQHKAVLCEKSFVTTQKEAKELAALARANRVLLMEAMWTRCLPAFIKARDWVKRGRIGKVKLITASFCFKADPDPNARWLNPKLGGGAMYDVGVYPIDFVIGILDEYPSAVNGLVKISATGVDESVTMSMDFASGALASLSFGFLNSSPRTASIYGSDGMIVVDECVGPHKCELFNEEEKMIDTFNDPEEDGFVHQIRHFAGLYRAGKLESDLIPLNDTIACAGIFDDLNKQWGIK
jgi:predicted dehydrogenase